MFFQIKPFQPTQTVLLNSLNFSTTLLLRRFCIHFLGGTNQCFEVGELYDTLLHGAPDGTVVCEMGYNVGASAVTFLHGMRNQPNSRLHSFDKSFPGNSAEFLNAVYNNKLTTHAGDISSTVPAFQSKGGKCDIIFLDSTHPTDLILGKTVARNKNTLFLYHWHFRNDVQVPPYGKPKTWFLNELETKGFEEHACSKIFCSAGNLDGVGGNGKVMYRETCFGSVPSGDDDQTESGKWWMNMIGGG